MILTSEPDLVVVGEAGDGHEAVAEAERLRPDVVLTDARMLGIAGIEATRRIMRVDTPPRVIVLTTFDRDGYVYEALRSGASAFMLKDAPEHQLLAAIRVVVDGGSLFAPSVTRRLIERFAEAARPSAPTEHLARLTARETEVLCLIARGMSNAEITDELVVNPTQPRRTSRASCRSSTSAIASRPPFSPTSPGSCGPGTPAGPDAHGRESRRLCAHRRWAGASIRSRRRWTAITTSTPRAPTGSLGSPRRDREAACRREPTALTRR